jgi:uridine kinase
MPYFVGVAGGTGAGKTTLVRTLVERFGGCVLDLDSYYVDRGAVSAEERRRLNYDEPDAIDVDLLVDHLGRLYRGEPIAKPVYSFEHHTRVGAAPLASARLVVVEGLFTWWWEPVRRLLALKVFVDAPADVRVIRRLRRDVAERGRTMDQVLQQYVMTVRPMHDLYVEPCRRSADLVVNAEGTPAEAAELVIAALRNVGDRQEARMAAAAGKA